MLTSTDCSEGWWEGTIDRFEYFLGFLAHLFDELDTVVLIFFHLDVGTLRGVTAQFPANYVELI